MPKGSKVSIVGAGGNVGSIVAYSIAMQGLAHEVILVDRDKDRAKGKALDMNQAAAALRTHSVVRAAETYEDIADSKVVVITAGFPRKPGMSRDDLLFANADIVSEVTENIVQHAPDSIIIVVTNPLDTMTYVALKRSGFPKNRVIGMAGILDGARMTHFIYEKLKFGAGQIRATVIGGHGDYMVPLPRYSTVAGIPITDLLTPQELQEVIDLTKNGGAQIVKLMGTSAYFAPGKATAIMVEAILKDSKKIYPCSTLLEGEYGVHGIPNGVPVTLGSEGVEDIIELQLTPKERQEFERSVQSVKELIDILEKQDYFGEKKSKES
ncbi:MAG: malate dehydrogenase [Epsilonproteobacteria bacterium]|nr:malate dehydrogenase [Campylobacterota bacterium]NPA57449.1 malate dehydrogenase [Campylobacterota bacterium]